MRFLELTLSVWKWEGVVFVGGSPSEYEAHAREEFGVNANVGSQSLGHTYVEYGKPWLLWVQSLDRVATLAHEALHVTSGVLEARGLKHTPESEEAYTYTMEAIINATLTAKKWERVAKKKAA